MGNELGHHNVHKYNLAVKAYPVVFNTEMINSDENDLNLTTKQNSDNFVDYLRNGGVTYIRFDKPYRLTRLTLNHFNLKSKVGHMFDPEINTNVTDNKVYMLTYSTDEDKFIIS